MYAKSVYALVFVSALVIVVESSGVMAEDTRNQTPSDLECLAVGTIMVCESRPANSILWRHHGDLLISVSATRYSIRMICFPDRTRVTWPYYGGPGKVTPAPLGQWPLF